MVKAAKFCDTALSYKGKNIPYSQMDCQAFVKAVLRKCGENVDWRGSNDMFRNHCTWTGTLSDAVTQFGAVLPGMVVFIVKHDGGEVARGYTDGFNASHVGIYCGGLECMESTSVDGKGVTSSDLQGKWTHCGKLKYVDFDAADNLTYIKTRLKTMKNELEELINAL